MVSQEQIYDTLSVGFGPASVALAIALVEHNAGLPSPHDGPAVYSALGGLQDALGYDAQAAAAATTASDGRPASPSSPASQPSKQVKACFIERYDGFKWHPGMMLPGSKMQISFLKDLATLRNPQSGYTFLAYLASFRPSRLVSFISLSTFNPSRREFADYLQWCANKVAGEIQQQGGQVAFGEEVVAVDALRPEEHSEGADVKVLRVTSRQVATGETITRYTRNLVVSAGGSPKFPAELSTPELVASQRVVHTAQFLERIDPLLERIVPAAAAQKLNRPLRLAVIGAGQSAAECFLHLRSKLAPLLPAGNDALERPQIDLLIRSSALRNTDESQFINEVFDPSMSQAMFRLGEEERTRVLDEAKNTNYSIVNPRTLEAVYEAMYDQKIEEDIAARSAAGAGDLARDPRLTIRPYTEIREARIADSTSALALTLHNPITHETREVEYDVVVCGTGYNRQAWRTILFPPASSAAAVEAEQAEEVVPLSDLFAVRRAGSASPPKLSLPDSVFAQIRPTARRSGSSSVGSSSASPSTAANSPTRYDSPSRHSSISYESTSTAPTSPPSPRSIVEPKLSAAAAASKAQTSTGPDFTVKENYRLDLPTKTASGADFKPTVWLQGSCEKTHGISDSLLSVLAVRSGEVVRSMLDEAYFDSA
ncbi:hypothetical protein JCM8115_002662 [Rhodotorula mucilaginosa]|uniref:L-ornithine N(5)-monooxygenase [NAD(P)H] n=1 Tax=Rhodotorula mucilaginosa TaxID=5537 RepID=A0A9P6VWP0_RHOMI|nr:hypothetical protein C6P46_006682 [Rhodotorula mucilaginosa]